MRRHYVTFMSPGTLVAETSTVAVDSWDVAVAAKLAADIVERHGARPFGFRFTTRVERDPVEDGEGGRLRVEPRTVGQSGLYYLGGEVRRYDDLVGRPDSSRTLEANMRGNGWPLCIVVVNGYRSTHPFEPTDAIVRAGRVEERGDDPQHSEYRNATLEKWRLEDSAPRRSR